MLDKEHLESKFIIPEIWTNVRGMRFCHVHDMQIPDAGFTIRDLDDLLASNQVSTHWNDKHITWTVGKRWMSIAAAKHLLDKYVLCAWSCFIVASGIVGLVLFYYFVVYKVLVR